MKSGPIVVTGAAGFIGSNVVAELNRRRCTDVIVVDRLGSDRKWLNLRELVFADIVSPDDLFAWLDTVGQVEAIVHMGACSSTTETDADHLLANNYRYTRQLSLWALHHGVRFIYASSAATYGDGSLGYSDDDAVTPQLRPLNIYGYSKHLFDMFALREGLFDDIVGLKFFNVFGPGETHKGDMRSVVCKAHDEIRASGSLSLFKSYLDGIAHGEQQRDFIHVDDAIAVIMHFLDHKEMAGLFNCGTGEARTWLDLGRAVFKAMDRDVEIRFIDMPPELRANYQYMTQADTAKLRAAGYGAPFLGLEDGVDRYVRTYLAAS